MRRPTTAVWLTIVALGIALPGCNRSHLPTRVEVRGKVVWQGKPLTEGTVFFQPVASNGGPEIRPARGNLNVEGVYRASSFQPGDGLMPGEYRVSVTSFVSRSNPDAAVPTPDVWRIPQRYGDPDKSGLRLTVPADARGRLVFDIDIKNE